MSNTCPLDVRRGAYLVALVALVAAALAVVALATGGGPASAQDTAAQQAQAAAPVVTAQRVLVARRSGDRDMLWLVSPAGAPAVAAGGLPGVAGRVALSPNGLNVAYLPANQRPRLWIGYGPKGPKTVSLRPAGVTAVDGLAWISNDRILVSGVTSGAYADVYRDRLFVVTVSSGAVRSFRGLRGTEPSAAPGAGRVAYVRLTTLDSGTSRYPDAPLIRESLRILRLSGTGAGREVAYERYRRFVDHRAFQEPKLSPAGDWLLTGQTGSDVSVTYSLRDAGSGFAFLTLSSGTLPAAAWARAGARVAFAAEPVPFAQARISAWAFEVKTGAMVRTPAAAIVDQQVLGLAWSADGALAIGTRTTTATSSRRILVAPADLSAVTDLGGGRLPVWVD